MRGIIHRCSVQWATKKCLQIPQGLYELVSSTANKPSRATKIREIGKAQPRKLEFCCVHPSPSTVNINIPANVKINKINNHQGIGRPKMATYVKSSRDVGGKAPREHAQEGRGKKLSRLQPPEEAPKRRLFAP